jgi:hypothetical protein
MINHARTLLLNKNGNERPAPDFFGEELVPEAYRAVPLPGYLIAMHQAIFGTDPDDEGRNFRLWQFMHLIHSTEFRQYVTALDTRITYLNSKSLVTHPFGTTSSPSNAPAEGSEVQPIGTPHLPATQGRLRQPWIVRADTTVTVSAEDFFSKKSQTTEVTVDGGLSSGFALPGQVEFEGTIKQEDPVTLLPSGAEWLLELLHKPGPDWDVPNIIGLVNGLGDTTMSALFGAGEEPYATFRQLWERELRYPYQISGLLLAVIYRTEDVRLGRS